MGTTSTRWLRRTALAALLGTAAAAGRAQEIPPPALPAGGEADTLAALRREIESLRQSYEDRLAALEVRLSELEAGAAAPAPPAQVAAAPARTSNYFNPSVSMVGNFVVAGGDELPAGEPPEGEEGEEAEAGLPAAELSESELALQAVIDPYARADFFLSFGEEGVEVEEGYATFTSLPANLLVKAGRMRAAFGKVNSLHVDVLPWPDEPLPIVNLLGSEGEGWIASGVSAAWLLPVPGLTFHELTSQVFRGEAEGLFESEERDELSYNTHYRFFRDLTEATNLDFGLSYGWGPNGGEPGADTTLEAIDTTLRWKPLRRAHYRGFTFRGELFRSRREQPGGTIEADGWFASGETRLAQRWFLGARYEATERALEAGLEDTGEALWVTFWPSEFSLLRGEARRRELDPDLTIDEFLLQLQFSIGAHAAHPF